MLSKAENERLTQVGPGTPMGNLMRMYWQPIAAASQLDENPTKAVRLLGEDLTLYKDRSGNLGLIEDRCPHRKVNLLYGIPEEEGLRCPYHGWLFNHNGQCLEQPYEQSEDPNSNFKEKIRIKYYPVQEAGGLVFAYLGPQPAPYLPMWDLLAWDNVYKDIGFAVLPCNYLQAMENSVDPVHAEWLHGVFANYVWERLGQPERQKPIPPHLKIGFDVFEHGIIKRRVLEGETEESVNWTHGHPLVFPHLLKVGGFQWRVPIDDTRTLHIWYYTYAPAEGATVPKGEPIPVYDVPVPAPDERGLPQWDLMDFAGGQDIVMWYTQGDIADRSTENLGRSDKGIILYRRLLKENLEKLDRGEDPMNVFRDPEEAKYVKLATEEAAGTRRFAGPGAVNAMRLASSAGQGGGATRYSPVLANREGASTITAEEVK